VVIFNLGSSNLQASLIRYYGTPVSDDSNKTVETFFVLGHETSTEFAGYKMDNAIAEVLA
jgi:molecular chaperone DnaK (HSP70)